LSTIICLGNELRGDDSAGFAVAERLRDRQVPALVAQPANLIDEWAGAEDVVVVDTVYSGAPPGTVHRIDALSGPLPAALRTGSTHLLGLGEAIELARALDRLPVRLYIVGIEGRAFGCGDPLTPEVERAVRLVVDELSAAG
jgi:hydrogenase maturation protease